MRYKLLGLTVVLLISTPFEIFAQKMSPIIVETGKPVPSIVRSGEPFRITYRAKYTDVVLIIEEQMRLNQLTLLRGDSDRTLQLKNSVTGNVEVIDLAIGEKFREGSEETGFINVQDFTYTFMLINDKKGNFKIPSFNFVWVRKRAGITVAQAKEKEQLREFPTKEVGISYVSSIVNPPSLDIRDTIAFDTFETLAGRLLIFTHGIISMISFLILVALIRFYRQPKAQKGDDSKDIVENVGEDLVETAMPTLSLRKARNKFLRGLKALEDELGSVTANEATVNVAGNLYLLVRMLVLAELSKGAVKAFGAHTPKEMCKYLAGLNDKQKKRLGRKHSAILDLAYRSKNYYKNMELGSRFTDPEREINELRHIVENMNLRRKWYSRFKHFVQKADSRAKSCILRR